MRTVHDLDRVAARACALRPRLAAWLARSYPSMPAAAVDDACSAPLMHLAEEPDRYLAAEAAGTFDALCRVVALRALRGEWRRKGWRGLEPLWFERGEEPVEAELADPAAPAPDGAIVRREVAAATRALVAEAARRTCRRHADALAAAMLDHLEEGLSFLEAAARHGVPREYLSHCCRELRRGDLAAAARRLAG